MPESVFGVILYSKIQDQENFEIYIDNLNSFFEHLSQPDLISRVYFVDDSDKKFQTTLKKRLLKLIAKTRSKGELIDVINNGSIYTAVNRVWTEVKEKYVISFNSDLRLIQYLPLGVIKKAFEKYPEVYSIHLAARGFGYSNSSIKKEIRKAYPYLKDYTDEEMTTWFCVDEKEKKVYSLPYKLYLKQKSGLLPVEAWGNELIPLIIDEKNALWITKWPSKFLKGYYTSHEAFAGNPSIFRTEIIQKYLPLHKRYIDEGPAECQEAYFRKTDIDCKYYLGYLNLQVFAIQYKDPNRPLFNIEKKYWRAFLERNSVPIIPNQIGIPDAYFETPKGMKFSLICRYCCLKTFLRWQLENLAIFFLGKSRARKLWNLLKSQF